MQTGKCLTWEDHWAASWKNLTSFHSTPSMRTAGDETADPPAAGRGALRPLPRARCGTRLGGRTPRALPGSEPPAVAIPP